MVLKSLDLILKYDRWNMSIKLSHIFSKVSIKSIVIAVSHSEKYTWLRYNLVRRKRTTRDNLNEDNDYSWTFWFILLR